MAFKKYSDYSAQTPQREAHYRTHPKKWGEGWGWKTSKKKFTPLLGIVRKKFKIKKIIIIIIIIK